MSTAMFSPFFLFNTIIRKILHVIIYFIACCYLSLITALVDKYIAHNYSLLYSALTFTIILLCLPECSVRSLYLALLPEKFCMSFQLTSDISTFETADVDLFLINTIYSTYRHFFFIT